MVCLLAAPWVQLSVSVGNGWPHNALRHHWLIPISCHFRDCKALLVTSLTHVSGAIASVQTFLFSFFCTLCTICIINNNLPFTAYLNFCTGYILKGLDLGLEGWALALRFWPWLHHWVFFSFFIEMEGNKHYGDDNKSSNSRPAPDCRVLPPGEFNGTIQKLLSVYCESFKTAAVTVCRYWWMRC